MQAASAPADAAARIARTHDEAVALLAQAPPLPELMADALALRVQGHGRTVSCSRKVFIPLTRLCRDSCAYCTFATTPSRLPAPYLTPQQVLAITRQGRDAGCHEALFTLGDRPESRYQAARSALQELGFASTVDYVAAMCKLVLSETGLLPHVNAGLMDERELAVLREVSVSQGLMLESVAERLCQRGGPHHGAPDKQPALRLAMIEAAGRLRIPFTSGILIGIGETRLERVQSLLVLRDLQRDFGHLQEVIVQNFRAKAGTRMAGADDAPLDELLWTLAMARRILGPQANLQAPPNLSDARFGRLLEAGINDWGGISPVTPDHVNPEAPWPAITTLQRATEAFGDTLVERLAVYPSYCQSGQSAASWLDTRLVPAVLQRVDAQGFVRDDPWSPGLPLPAALVRSQTRALDRTLHDALHARPLQHADIVRLFGARGAAFDAVLAAADGLRRQRVGDTVSYVVNRNINYTNLCTHGCRFCAFSKGRSHEDLRGAPYAIDPEEVGHRSLEAWQRGATEVCMQGGIHPRYSGHDYLAFCRAVKQAVPAMHVHAFSPLEVWHGAQTLGLGVDDFLACLRDAGLGSLPGTAAEVLDDEVRRLICPDKLSTALWLDIVERAHRAGLRTTATLMFGHVDTPAHWATHLLAVRELQSRTGGFTEFVPLPFVHMEAPLYRKGGARKGPTLRETLLVHAVARLALDPLITNIQTSWVKMGADGAALCLDAGANDLGGTLMNESISRAAGAAHGQELDPAAMDRLVTTAGRLPRQRNTLYGTVPAERRAAARVAPALQPLRHIPIRRKELQP